ncbi:prolipoprotein diacylglyceryl transferase [Anaerolineales bacterium]
MEFTSEYILIGNSLQIRYYGIIIVIALLVASWVAARIAKRAGLNPDHIWGGLTWAIIPGIIFARLWFVFFPPAVLLDGCGIEGGVCMDLTWMAQNIGNLQNGPLAIWSGGLSIFGALLGGLLGVVLYTRRHHLNLMEWLDIAGIVIPLAQAIGRWANYFNQELYGAPTNLPWGIQIDAAHRSGQYRSLIDYPLDTGFHPIFLYESLWCLVTFFVLLYIYNNYRHKLYRGDIFALYIVFYSSVRFLLEFVRLEVAHIPGTSINSSQAITGLLFILALGYLLWKHFISKPPKQIILSKQEVDTNS